MQLPSTSMDSFGVLVLLRNCLRLLFVPRLFQHTKLLLFFLLYEMAALPHPVKERLLVIVQSFPLPAILRGIVNRLFQTPAVLLQKAARVHSSQQFHLICILLRSLFYCSIVLNWVNAVRNLVFTVPNGIFSAFAI